MKNWLLILLLLPVLSYSQLTPIEEHFIDSLKQEIKTAKHDSTIVMAWKLWDDVIFVFDPELDLKLIMKIDSLCSENLEKDLNAKEKQFFMKMKGFAINVIGITYHNQADYEKAVYYYKQSVEIKKEIGDKMGLASSLSNIGLIYYEQGNFKDAEEYLIKGLVIEQEIGDKEGIAGTYNNLGNLYSSRGDYDKAIEYHTKSMKIDDEIGYMNGMANSLNNIGLIYFDQGDFEKAIEYYEKSLKIEEEEGDQKGVAYSYDNIGSVYESMGEMEMAIEYYLQSYEIEKSIGDTKGMASVLCDLGNAYQVKKEYEVALDYYMQSLSLEEEMGRQQGIARAMNGLGSVYFEVGEFEKALQYGKQALKMAEGMTFASETTNSAKLLWHVYKKFKDYKESLKMYELFVATRDSVLSEANEKEVIKQQFKYAYGKQAAADSVKAAEAAKLKDAEVALHKAESQQLEQQKYVLFGGLALALLFGGFVFNRFRVTNKQKGIIEKQKEVVEEQKKTVDLAFNELEEKNQEILDSIKYAKRIQSAVLPPTKIVKEYLPSSFILYKPKDIVAGDFYWLEHKDDKVLFAACDCTGHGVPGAMVSVVCVNGLNRSVREHGLTEPGQILDQTREIVIQEFEKSEEEVKDGMDIALCSLEGNVLKYAGAHNPLWVIRNGAEEVEEIKADKQPIGKFDVQVPYTTHEVVLQPGDSIYIFSDGYVDQFGGEKGKKFKSANFKKLLLSIQNEPMDKQKNIIDEMFESWKGNVEQIDDVCVIGVRV